MMPQFGLFEMAKAPAYQGMQALFYTMERKK